MYEVLWYNHFDESYETREFKTRSEALSFYKKIKDDPLKHSFWVTKRNEDWEVIEDIIY